jgi:hypothetical protein
MTLLRVLLPGAPQADRADAWALFDDAGALLRHGRDRPEGWPDADRREAVLAASLARVAVVALPPLPPGRVATAAAFALEDALAGAPATQHLVAGRQGPDGRVPVTIVARSALEPVAACRPPFARVIAEPELATPAQAMSPGGPATAPVWRWCQGDGDGFVRTGDGSAFAVSPLDAGGALPPELAQALASAVAHGSAPTVRAEVDAAAGSTARWQQLTGATFIPAARWQWHAAGNDAFESARDLALPVANAAATLRATPWQSLRPAALVAGLAVALHVVATAAEWIAGTIRASRDRAAWVELARDAGAPVDAAADSASARTAVARRYAEARHARGLPAPDDAGPLLARAAPALASLPPGTVRRATYAGGAWTIELAPLDAAALAGLDARLKIAGTPALAASGPAGVRLRIGGPP